MTVVEDYCITGLAQGADLTMGVDVVAFFYVAQDVGDVTCLSFGSQLVVAALRTYFGILTPPFFHLCYLFSVK